MILRWEWCNPLRKVLCPSCFRTFPAREVHFRCENGESKACTDQPDELLTKLLGLDPEVPRLDRLAIVPDRSSLFFGPLVAPTAVQCPVCSEPSSHRACPLCHSELPSEIEVAQNRIIAILGMRGSGKTMYIAHLIDQLRQRLPELNATLAPATHSTAALFKRNYGEPILRDGIRLQGTAPAASNPELRIPLIYRISFGATGKNGSSGVSASAHLVFFDASGEDLETSRLPELYRRYIRSASALVLLLDPLSITGLKDHIIRSGLPSGQIVNSTHPFQHLLDNLCLGILDSEGARKQVRKPTAVVVSKSDLFRTLLPSEKLPFLERPDHIGGFDRSDCDNVSAFIEQKLQNWGEQETVVKVRQKFSDYHYFALSSLGMDPSGESVANARPLRVEDPIFWILNHWGLLRAR